MPRVRTLLAMTGAAILGLAMLGGPAASAEPDTPYQVIANAADPAQVLDARAQGTASGTEVWTYSHHGGPNQLWTLRSWPDGTVSIVGQQSGRCITPTSPGGGVELHDCVLYQPAQHWYRTYQPGGAFAFESAYFPNQCLGLGYQPNSRAIVSPCNGYPNQHWLLTYVG